MSSKFDITTELREETPEYLALARYLGSSFQVGVKAVRDKWRIDLLAVRRPLSFGESSEEESIVTNARIFGSSTFHSPVLDVDTLADALHDLVEACLSAHPKEIGRLPTHRVMLKNFVDSQILEELEASVPDMVERPPPEVPEVEVRPPEPAVVPEVEVRPPEPAVVPEVEVRLSKIEEDLSDLKEAYSVLGDDVIKFAKTDQIDALREELESVKSGVEERGSVDLGPIETRVVALEEEAKKIAEFDEIKSKLDTIVEDLDKIKKKLIP